MQPNHHSQASRQPHPTAHHGLKCESQTTGFSWRQLASGWMKWLRAVTGFFNTTREPRIVRRQDRQGQIDYRVYDPVHDVYHQFNSKEDVLMWLEERYHR